MNKGAFRKRIAYVLSLVMMLSVCSNVWATDFTNELTYNQAAANSTVTTDSALQDEKTVM